MRAKVPANTPRTAGQAGEVHQSNPTDATTVRALAQTFAIARSIE